MVGEYDIDIVQGADQNDFDVTPTNDDGSPIDLSGSTADLQIRPEVRSDTIYDNLTTANGRLVISSFIKDFNEVPTTFYKITVKFPNTITDDYTWVTGVYDLKVTTGTNVYRYLEGEVFINRSVSR